MLGLAVSALSLEPGQCRSRSELAAYISAASEVLAEMGREGGSTRISRDAIRQVEERGLRKCRRGLLGAVAREYLAGEVKESITSMNSPRRVRPMADTSTMEAAA